jgi:DNA-binding NtrC family response regulator
MKRAYRASTTRRMKVLMSHHWKGNVRELDNVIEHAMILGNGEWIQPPTSRARSASARTRCPPSATTSATRCSAYERMHIEAVLRAARTTSAGGATCSACRCRRSTGS